MKTSRLNAKGLLFAGLIGTTLLAASLVQAQDNPRRREGTEATAQLPKGEDAKARPQPIKELLTRAVLDYDNAGTAKDVSALLTQVLVTYDQGDETLGATLKPIDDALRAQLDIPAGQGVLVFSLRHDGPSAQAGLKVNDILLSLADKPLTAAQDMDKQLRAAGDAPVYLRLLRTGKPVTLQVRPVYRVTLGPVEEKKTEYYIGVSIDPVNDPLRTQLALPAGQGVVVTDVVSGSPAEKAGVKKHDLILALADTPVESPEHLARQVQAGQDKPTTLRILRGGKPLVIPIMGAVRKVEASPSQDREAVRLWVFDHEAPTNPSLVLNQRRDARLALSTLAGTDPVGQRLDHLERELKALRRLEAVEKELKALREAVDRLHESVKAGRGTKGD
jgi:C-terminal processing protease CtpA/Prc